ncbi:transcriptional regulator GutM [Lichenifustis flavocetrariae]|uniref:Transcriptional regulator GutM n=1 Tax=Lichenifustis flavocetrariae TaxID=2949735 RepID=A0AA42CI87_9HYPH|nr:transcriptional regulator GutM [Lichenifustis flavocetrariae]MCW6508104.1 transcriptional regulator GutM [Lichenifustis flavocetrariae]
MPLWQIALMGLVVAWGLQALGTYVQMRHFSATMGDVSRLWPDGFVGAGNARSTFGAGVILLLVVSPDRTVRRALIMRGRTVFARFARLSTIEGKTLDDLPEEPAFRDKATGGALIKAAEQIERAALKLQQRVEAAA